MRSADAVLTSLARPAEIVRSDRLARSSELAPESVGMPRPPASALAGVARGYFCAFLSWASVVVVGLIVTAVDLLPAWLLGRELLDLDAVMRVVTLSTIAWLLLALPASVVLLAHGAPGVRAQA